MKRWMAGFLGLIGLVLAQGEARVNAGDTAWMLMSTALVLLMTPGLALFYGGLVRAKNVLSTMMMSFAAMGVVGISWAMLGYSLAFSNGNGYIGGLSQAFLNGVGLGPSGSIPSLLFMAFQATFAIITAALISGAVVERMRFGTYLVFIALWSLLIYSPVAHWVWGGGWLQHLGVLDFAGGTVVHINSGVAALVAALALGRRKDYGRQAQLPHNVPFVLLGAALLWFGWFGFNGGSALASNGSAALAFVNTMLAPAATLVVWMLLDSSRTGKVTAVGAATGVVIGLVAITPAAGFIGPIWAIILGAIAAFPSYFWMNWRARSGLDDSLDAFGGHGIGGIVGALLTGVFAQAVWGGTNGLIGGNAAQVGIQIIAVLAVLAYSAVGTLVLLRVIGVFVPLRVDRKEEGLGLDLTMHGEDAYTNGEGAVLVSEAGYPAVSRPSVKARGEA